MNSELCAFKAESEGTLCAPNEPPGRFGFFRSRRRWDECCHQLAEAGTGAVPVPIS
jgi:hypothetical protein